SYSVLRREVCIGPTCNPAKPVSDLFAFKSRSSLPEEPSSDPPAIPRRKLRHPGRHPSEPAGVIYASIP
ncbi:hypothetical protein AVEN_177724-1, partial [Araneus ventricosus]